MERRWVVRTAARKADGWVDAKVDQMVFWLAAMRVDQRVDRWAVLMASR